MLQINVVNHEDWNGSRKTGKFLVFPQSVVERTIEVYFTASPVVIGQK